MSRLPLLFNPLDKSAEGQMLTAHDFLLVASITESRLIGTSKNALALMVDLHRFLGDELFTARDVSLLKNITKEYVYNRRLGPEKDRIPEILVSVNSFMIAFLRETI